jgi:hypothetical protein
MFSLCTNSLPGNAVELERLLNESLRRLFSGAMSPVSVREKAYPEIAELRIALDGAKLRTDAPRPPVLPNEASPALALDMLQIEGSGITVGPTVLEMKLSARDVRLFQSRDAKGEITLILQSAADGEAEISAAKDAMENAIRKVVKREAEKHGVTIEQVELTMRSRGARGLDAEVQLRARKLVFTTTIRIAAKLDLDEQLNATISEVRCTGEGAIGSLACGFLAPHLQKVDGRSFSLMALPLGEIRLRDVGLSVSDRLTVNAEFGA